MMDSSAQLGTLAAVEMEMQRLMADPTVSYWLRHAIRDCSARDPLDALNDVAVLKGWLKLRLNALLAAAGRASCDASSGASGLREDGTDRGKICATPEVEAKRPVEAK